MVGLEALGESAIVQAGFGSVSPIVVLEDQTPLQMHALPDLTAKSCGGAGFFLDDRSPVPARTRRQRADDRRRLAGGVVGVPGTSVTLTVAAAPTGGVPVVRVQAHVALAGTTVPTVAVAGGAEVPFERRGHALEARGEGPAASGPWSVTVRSPPDGPWLLLSRVVTGTAEAPQYLIGTADPPTVVPLTRAPPPYAAPPPGLPLNPEAPVPGREANLWRYDVSSFGVPSHDAVFEAAGTGCSPLELLEDGKPIRDILGPDGKAISKLIHAGGVAKVSFGDGRDPGAGDHVYTFRLDPSRVCGKGKGLWLYPGGELSLTVGPDALSALVSGATELDLVDELAALEASIPAQSALEPRR